MTLILTKEQLVKYFKLVATCMFRLIKGFLEEGGGGGCSGCYFLDIDLIDKDPIFSPHNCLAVYFAQ